MDFGCKAAKLFGKFMISRKKFTLETSGKVWSTTLLYKTTQSNQTLIFPLTHVPTKFKVRIRDALLERDFPSSRNDGRTNQENNGQNPLAAAQRPGGLGFAVREEFPRWMFVHSFRGFVVDPRAASTSSCRFWASAQV